MVRVAVRDGGVGSHLEAGRRLENSLWQQSRSGVWLSGSVAQSPRPPLTTSSPPVEYFGIFEFDFNSIIQSQSWPPETIYNLMVRLNVRIIADDALCSKLLLTNYSNIYYIVISGQRSDKTLQPPIISHYPFLTRCQYCFT